MLMLVVVNGRAQVVAGGIALLVVGSRKQVA